jgi:serine protease DegQ
MQSPEPETLSTNDQRELSAVSPDQRDLSAVSPDQRELFRLGETSNTNFSGWRFWLTCILAGLALAFVIERLRQPKLAPSAMGFADAVAKASPTVVSIFADKIVTEQQLGVVNDPTMRRFLGVTPVGPSRQRLEQNLGSAVIVRSDGTLITNDHVVAGFDNIRAVLWDGRVARASIVGRDAESDLAVLKVDLDNLPAAEFAPIEQLRVGDAVLAIGNPYGYSQTVTSGIISALARPDRNWSTFIQTDAAINVGNSGGALVNERGQLVGINTAALDRVDVGVAIPGISFAIPSSVVHSVLEAIERDGEVIRGWMGAIFEDRTMITSNGEPRRVTVVLEVYQNTPAERAGLARGDILESFNGTLIESARALNAAEAAIEPGSAVRVNARRAGVPVRFDLLLTKRPS